MLRHLPNWKLPSQFGGYKAPVRPVPIPNTAVKRSLADGSGCIASARVGCRQSFKKSRRKFSPVFLFSKFLPLLFLNPAPNQPSEISSSRAFILTEGHRFRKK